MTLNTFQMTQISKHLFQLYRNLNLYIIIQRGSFVRFEIFFINMLKLKSETKNQDSLTAIFDSDSTTNNALGKFQ